MLLSPLRYINPISGNRGGSTFSIAKSFYLDGVDEKFSVPYEPLNAVMSGTNKTFSLSFHLKRSGIDVVSKILSNYTSGADNTVNLDFQVSNILRFRQDDAGFKELSTTETYTSMDWLFFTIAIDGTTPSNSTIYCNGVEQTIGTNTLTTSADPTTVDFAIGSLNTTTNQSNFNGYIQSMSLTNTFLTLADHQNLYNNGKPKNPQKLFGDDCKWFFNPDNSGDTAQFSVVDSVNSITATSINMEDADKTTVTPY